MPYFISSFDYRNIRPNITTNTMAKFDRMTAYMHNDLFFHIRSANDEGNSQMASVIVVPKTRFRLKHPVQIKKILHDRIYHLSWKAPEFSDDIDSYTVFWCVTKNEFLNQCDVSDKSIGGTLSKGITFSIQLTSRVR